MYTNKICPLEHLLMDFVLHFCSRLYSLFSSVDDNYLCFEYKLRTEVFCIIGA